jgi:hypothetical protein
MIDTLLADAELVAVIRRIHPVDDSASASRVPLGA